MFRSLLPLLIAALPGFGMSVTAVAEEQLALFSAEGYRQTQYRSPTPATAEGAQTLDTAALQALLAKEPDVVLVDVYRSQWLAGRFVDSEPHANLPGSIWLANTGETTSIHYGVIRYTECGPLSILGVHRQDALTSLINVLRTQFARTLEFEAEL